MLQIKRVYEPIERVDGYRILVDRLWPRGVAKQEASIAAWLKTITPSAELRAWFRHDPDKFQDFAKRYRYELKQAPDSVRMVLDIMSKQPVVTLLYAAKDPAYNHAAVLRDYLKRNIILQTS